MPAPACLTCTAILSCIAGWAAQGPTSCDTCPADGRCQIVQPSSGAVVCLKQAGYSIEYSASAWYKRHMNHLRDLIEKYAQQLCGGTMPEAKTEFELEALFQAHVAIGDVDLTD